jgi:hypothetical protein
LPCAADAFPDDELLDDASLAAFDAGLFGAVCAKAAHAVNSTTIADWTSDDLQIRFENIAPPDGVTKLFSLAVCAVGRKLCVFADRQSYFNSFAGRARPRGQGESCALRGRAPVSIPTDAKYLMQSNI